MDNERGKACRLCECMIDPDTRYRLSGFMVDDPAQHDNAICRDCQDMERADAGTKR